MSEHCDYLDDFVCRQVVENLAKKSRFGQELFTKYVLDEYGQVIVKSKEQAIRILDDQNASFELRVAATLFVNAYKKVMESVQK